MKYSIEKIAGIDCIFAPMNDIGSITIQILCKAGSTYETAEQNGIAHCLEHMFFKGGERYKNQKEVSETLDSIGADYNAFTSSNAVEYFVKCAPDLTEKAIDVLADMMMNAKFDSKELENEKGVIIQEMKMYDDNPRSLLGKKWRTWYLGENSFGRPIIGNQKTVSSFTQSDLRNYKDSLYTKDNLIIVVAGKGADNEKIKKLISKYFEGMKEKKSVNQAEFSNHHPDPKESSFKKGTEQNHLLICADGIPETDERKYAAKVLAGVLGGNMSSRLFQNIRTKEGLCYYISASHGSSPYPYQGIFMIGAGMDKDRFEFGLKRIREEIENLAKNGVSQDEFNKAIGYLQGQLQMGIETSDEMASFLGEQYLIYNKIETLEDVLKEYKKLTLNDVNQLAPMLDLKNCYTFHIE